jgi:predicted dehydrogenase
MRGSRRKLKAGVIGTGMGRYHMEGFATHPSSELLAVCDLNAAEAQGFADRYGAKHVFTDYRKMIAMEELDIVAVAAPTNLHARMTIEALRAGKDVLCEKPMATRLADAEAMVREAKRRKKRLMIHMIVRFMDVQWAMHDLVERGELGDVYYAKSHWMRRKGMPRADFAADGDMGRGEWFVKKRQAGGGASFDIGVHAYDLAWWLIGCPKPKSVLASTYSELLPGRLAKVGVKGDVDDLAAALVKFDTGQTIFVEVSWDAHQEPYFGYELYGTERGAGWGEWAEYATLYQDDKRGRPKESKRRPKRKAPSGYWHFVDACLDRRVKLVASGEECLNVMRVLDAIHRSQKAGRAVSL